MNKLYYEGFWKQCFRTKKTLSYHNVFKQCSVYISVYIFLFSYAILLFFFVCFMLMIVWKVMYITL